MAANLIIDINLQHAVWQEAIPELQPTIHKIARHVFETTGLSDYTNEIEVSILLTDDSYMSELNMQYREKEGPTNVLSFPQEDLEAGEYEEWEEESIILGDIIVALETIQKEAIEQKKKLHHHFIHMLVHGMLHLQGYDHGTEREATQMEALEADILSDFSIPDPYADDSMK